MIEVIVKEHEIQIYIDREQFRRWLGVTTVTEVPWEAPTDAEKATSEGRGFTTGDGEKKEFPNDGDGRDKAATEVTPEVTTDDKPAPGDSIDLFDKGPNDIGGTLQDDAKAKEKMKAMKDWLKSEKFNYKNFCRYLYQLTEVAGFKLSTPLIGLTQKKEPTLFQLATRYYSYWLSSKDYIAGDYKTFLLAQLADMGITIQMVKDEFNGEEIDPTNLPKALAVTK